MARKKKDNKQENNDVVDTRHSTKPWCLDNQKAWLSTHLAEFVAARELGGGPGRKNIHMDEFINNTFDAFVDKWSESLAKQDLPNIGLGGSAEEREKKFKLRLKEWYKNKSGPSSSGVAKVEYIQFDVDGRKGAIKRPFVLLDLFREALEPVLAREWSEHIQKLPKGVPPPLEIAFRNSRLSYHWNSAPPEVVRAVEEEVLRQKADAALLAGRNPKAPWRMNDAIEMSGEERLDRAMQQQVKVDAISRSLQRVHDQLAEQCGAVCVTLWTCLAPKEGGKQAVMGLCNGLTADTKLDYSQAFPDVWKSLLKTYGTFSQQVFTAKDMERLSMSRKEGSSPEVEVEGEGGLKEPFIPQPEQPSPPPARTFELNVDLDDEERLEMQLDPEATTENGTSDPTGWTLPGLPIDLLNEVAVPNQLNNGDDNSYFEMDFSNFDLSLGAKDYVGPPLSPLGDFDYSDLFSDPIAASIHDYTTPAENPHIYSQKSNQAEQFIDAIHSQNSQTISRLPADPRSALVDRTNMAVPPRETPASPNPSKLPTRTHVPPPIPARSPVLVSKILASRQSAPPPGAGAQPNHLSAIESKENASTAGGDGAILRNKNSGAFTSLKASVTKDLASLFGTPITSMPAVQVPSKLTSPWVVIGSQRPNTTTRAPEPQAQPTSAAVGEVTLRPPPPASPSPAIAKALLRRPPPLPPLPAPSTTAAEQVQQQQPPHPLPDNIPPQPLPPPSSCSATDKRRAPKWERDCQKQLYKAIGGSSEEHEKLLDLYATFESMFEYKPERTGLPTALEPYGVQLFREACHDYPNPPPRLVENFDPSITLAHAYFQDWLIWYNSMMPKSRKVKPGKLGKQIAPADFSEWAAICRGGDNGMSLLLMSLTWRHDNLAMNEKDSDNYTLVVNDLIWVLGVLIEGGNSGKITWLSDEEADAGRRGSKRTAAQQNVETLLRSKRAKRA